MNSTQLKDKLENRLIFVNVGIINIILFHFAIYKLFYFLLSGGGSLTSVSYVKLLIVDSLLTLFFCVPHSLLLNTKIKRYLLNFIPASLYSTIYSIHACIALVLMDKYWLTHQGFEVLIPENYRSFMTVLYILSWLFMLWTMLSIGLFRQSGIEEWWKAINKKKMKYSLTKKGPFSFCRHPIYLAFLAMSWTSPYMTLDRVFLAIAFTIYIFIGVYFKEKRLIKNRSYKQYSKRVPLFPLIPTSLDKALSQIIWRAQL